ncbi:hypothetical protein SPRG_19802 [Saprolegnia parasitica CBS 223.65]|uniref:LicD protein n=1 Tax=Saprolegnia parasitica (strain CBS 223.65) TaxID=695850 RepID=A0A067CM12_SAPPC|nr:hypothetical protein SPRG_19802 [Saprolegnia parasitica CBS 223.65]KDO30250.1 hypothetical protein SPRG_19802 [Saprolegnia parasitica CBS 223.65]|eukprot:XP_012199055.1 hypothetical protein SPRG_19802 [Saprolegnia parasitica CBS 223.65]
MDGGPEDVVGIAFDKAALLRARILTVPKRYIVLLLLLLATVVYYRDARTTEFLTLARYPMRTESCSYLSPTFQATLDVRAVHPPPLVLSKEHASVLRGVADASLPTQQLSWKDCLPMHSFECGLMAGSVDALLATSERKCRSSILHHLLSAATTVLERHGSFGTPIGAALQHIYEYGALPPNAYTLNVATDATEDLTSSFWADGFAHFYDPQLRARITCVAPHHALASALYAPELPLVMGPDNGVPYLRFASLTAAPSLLGGDDETAYVLDGSAPIARHELFPLRCLGLYNVAVQTPHFAPAFFSVLLDTNAPYAFAYPSESCEAHCDVAAPTKRMQPRPNLPRCPLQDDSDFRAKTAKYAAKQVPLLLAPAHAEILAPFRNDVPRLRAGKQWTYCLPIRPQQCGVGRGDKSSLFETPAGRPCRSAVLHMLMEDMLTALNAEDQVAFVYFGTLLGAWRDQAMIPHTPDTDIIVPWETDWDHLQDVMWAKGYYVFERAIHAACVAPHHPLAPLLYAPASSLTDSPDHGTPYLDLYMWRDDGDQIYVQTAEKHLPPAMMFPLTCDARIFASRVPSIQFPEGMFMAEYGASYVKDTKLLFNKCESYCDDET